jgi:hypothetical protein
LIAKGDRLKIHYFNNGIFFYGHDILYFYVKVWIIIIYDYGPLNENISSFLKNEINIKIIG